MPRTLPRRAGTAAMMVVVLYCALGLASGAARADTPPDETASCIASVEQAQLARYQGKLRAARDGFARCSSETCPAPIRSDCTRWLQDAEARLPSARIVASWADGTPAAGLRVYVDGERVGDVDHAAVDVDPGEHTFRVEVDGGRPVEAKAVFRDGEKDRAISVAFVRLAPPAAAAATPGAIERPVPLGFYVAAGGGLASLAIFGAVGFDAMEQLNTMRSSSCAQAHACPDAPAARERLLISNIGEIAGGAALAVAVWLYLTRKAAEPPPRTTAALGAGARGAWAVVETAF
jgi:hypothetical protein